MKEMEVRTRASILHYQAAATRFAGVRSHCSPLLPSRVSWPFSLPRRRDQQSSASSFQLEKRPTNCCVCASLQADNAGETDAVFAGASDSRSHFSRLVLEAVCDGLHRERRVDLCHDQPVSLSHHRWIVKRRREIFLVFVAFAHDLWI